jgi:GAF domain-containing protein
LGVKELISCRLQVSGQNIGCISLHADKTNHFTKEHIGLFKSVADIVAVAVGNILGGEESEKQEHEKLQLLNISKHIASVRIRMISFT